MKYAVIAISGTQYKVAENEIVTVNNVNLNEGETATTDQVLLSVDNDKVTLGQPTVKDASVEYKVVKNYQDKKVRIFKYKSKSRYRKTQGFRAQVSDIQILKIK